MRGISVTLYEETATSSTDAFGVPIVTEKPVTIENVLVGEVTTDAITDTTSLYTKVIRYTLGIPKGDNHDWVNKKVEWTDAYGTTHHCKTFGFPMTGVETSIPTPWHMKVRCEEYG